MAVSYWWDLDPSCVEITAKFTTIINSYFQVTIINVKNSNILIPTKYSI